MNLSGGLGNQIFEILYCLSYFDISKNQVQIIINTYYLDQYKTKREFELDPLLKMLDVDYQIVNRKSLRLAKIFSKITRSDFAVKWANSVYVDSYHQDFNFYTRAQINNLKSLISKIRSQVHAENSTKYCLHHRLTDFTEHQTMKKLSDEIDYFKKEIKNSEYVVITDDADEFKSLALGKLKTDQVFDFKELSPWDLLLEFARYETLLSNGSTLSFFGALFGNCKHYITSNLVLSHNFKIIRSNSRLF